MLFTHIIRAGIVGGSFPIKYEYDMKGGVWGGTKCPPRRINTGLVLSASNTRTLNKFSLGIVDHII